MRPVTFRLPFAPLERLIFVEVGPRLNGAGQFMARVRVVAEVLGVSQRTVARLRVGGLSIGQADRFAIAAGWHPTLIWPEWAVA